MSSKLKIAIVHDWLVGMRGGEKCLENILELYPNSDIYTAFYEPKNVSKIINSKDVYTSILNLTPFAKYVYRYLLPFYPVASNSLSKKINKKEYDIVISISHCLAKNIKVDSFHLCYCLTPARYLWDKYDSYFKSKWYEPFVKIVTKYLRSWDLEGSKNVDSFVCISEYIKQRIRKVYNLDSEVLYPPVKTEWISNTNKNDTSLNQGKNKNSFLCVSALVPYKNVDTIVLAFNELGYELNIVGSGPEISRIKKIAKSNIKILGRVSEAKLGSLYSESRALIFGAEEDFGIVPLEAQANGLGVIALGKGGALETVINEQTGIFYENNSKESIINAIDKFIELDKEITIEKCVNQASRFSQNSFKTKFKKLLTSKLEKEISKTNSKIVDFNKDVKKTLANI